MSGLSIVMACAGVRSRAAACRSAGVALQAGAVPHHREVAAFGAALALIALHARFHAAVIGADHGGRLQRDRHFLADLRGGGRCRLGQSEGALRLRPDLQRLRGCGHDGRP